MGQTRNVKKSQPARVSSTTLPTVTPPPPPTSDNPLNLTLPGSGQNDSSQTVSPSNPDRQLIIVPGERLLTDIKLYLCCSGPAAPLPGPQVMTLQFDTRPLLTPLIPTVFGQ